MNYYRYSPVDACILSINTGGVLNSGFLAVIVDHNILSIVVTGVPKYTPGHGGSAGANPSSINFPFLSATHCNFVQIHKTNLCFMSCCICPLIWLIFTWNC